MDDIWNMGGYGIYVWPSYALAIGLLLLLTLYLEWRLESSQNQLNICGGDET